MVLLMLLFAASIVSVVTLSTFLFERPLPQLGCWGGSIVGCADCYVTLDGVNGCPAICSTPDSVEADRSFYRFGI
ncbi:hypothetical protein LX32DRAFT_634028 [Colletotrichum zoysiae]|uniref:Uncharacterized protein n=1 Tax=Colletotrichum zoysiae TaxID=1216348 RepID=A0AAD9HSX1_9PEZI|nr:hypothetical protein LX32DRAFT_634028 [Colletotrichum zoysiae]